MNKYMYKKLLKIQEEIGAIKKDATNPFFKSKYFDINSLLEQVKPVLNKHSLVLLQGLDFIEYTGHSALNTQLIDSISGEKLEFKTPLPDTVDAQKAGSAITYFRRYALQSLLALEAEDDDGNLAVKPAYTKVADKKIYEEKNKKDVESDIDPF